MSATIFTIKRSEIEGRLDPEFYNPKYFKIFKNEKSNWIRLNSIVKTLKHPPEYKRIFVENGYQLIRSQNVRPLGINLDENPVYLANEIVNNSSSIFPKKNDILIVRSGVNAGDVAVVEEDFPNTTVGADTLLLNVTGEILPKFVQIYFFTDVGRNQLNRYLTGATNKHINSFSIKRVYFPKLDLQTQKQCINIFETSLFQKEQKQQQAKQLLDSIDSYLLDELGIKLPQKDNSLSKRIFTTKFSEVSGGRWDPKFYSTEAKSIKNAVENSKYNTKVLEEFIVQCVAGDWGYEEDENIPNTTKCLVIRSTEFDNDYNLKLDNTRAKYRLIPNLKFKKIDLRENDLLIEKSGGSEDQPVGRIAILTKDILESATLCFSNFIYKIRVHDIDAEYLFCFLKTAHNIKLTEIMFAQTNGLQNLIMQTYFNQKIPLPPLPKQKEIASHIREIREQAKQLQVEAEQTMQEAKKQIEKMILGE